MKNVVIIGSGLSGLSCAYYLKKNGINTAIYDQSNQIGGRIFSENIDGFICDNGFQILLNNYQEVKKILDYKDLNMNYFESGATIYTDSQIYKVYNPIFHPIKSLKSDFNKIFSYSDYLNVLKTLFINNDMSTKQYFKRSFSKSANRLFFEPFFKGVFLDDNLENDFTFFKKLFIKFAFGKAGLPKNGMYELVKQIKEKSKILNINFNMKLKNISNNIAFFQNGEKVSFDYIVLALPIETINVLFNLNLKIEYNTNSTFYIKSEKNVLGKALLLVPDKKYKINSIQCLSNVSSNYSNNNKSLYSVSSNDHNAKKETIINEFTKITKIQQSEMQLIKSYRIKKALHKNIYKIDRKDNIYFCGDWQKEPSIDGALKSGRLTAEKIINICKT